MVCVLVLSDMYDSRVPDCGSFRLGYFCSRYFCGHIHLLEFRSMAELEVYPVALLELVTGSLGLVPRTEQRWGIG